MKTEPSNALLELSFRNLSKLMLSTIQLAIIIVVRCSPQKCLFVFVQQQDVHPHSQVCFRSIVPSKIDSLNVFNIGHILCASISPTGSLLAIGSGDTTARLWDLDTEAPSHVLSGHKGWVLCLEWERKLATGG